jgi:hypothetical protein
MEDADFIAYADACLSGLGFWILRNDLGFYSLVPNDIPSEWIYYREALGVISALHYAVDHILQGG